MAKKCGKLRWIAALLGLCVLLWGLTGLAVTDDLLQYAMPARPGDEESPWTQLQRSKELALENISSSLAAHSVYCVGTGDVSAVEKSESCTIYGVSGGYFDVYPAGLAQGRIFGYEEMNGSNKVVILDNRLAFALFAGQEALGAVVNINGDEFRVVGLVEHDRGLGDVNEYFAWAPLNALATQPFDVAVIAARPVDGAGASVMFEAAMKDYFGGGNFYNLKKEAMRRTIILRVALFLAGLWAFLRILRRANGLTGRLIGRCREMLREEYAAKLLWRFALICLMCACMYAALIGALYALMHVSVQPLYTFTEWVPENPVEISSIQAVFWNLIAQSALHLQASTRQMHLLDFYGGMVRWGLVIGLVGGIFALLDRHAAKKKPSAE